MRRSRLRLEDLSLLSARAHVRTVHLSTVTLVDGDFFQGGRGAAGVVVLGAEKYGCVYGGEKKGVGGFLSYIFFAVLSQRKFRLRSRPLFWTLVNFPNVVSCRFVPTGTEKYGSVYGGEKKGRGGIFYRIFFLPFCPNGNSGCSPGPWFANF